MATTTTRRRTTTRRATRRRPSARTRRKDAFLLLAVVGLFAIVGIAQWINQHRGIALAGIGILTAATAWYTARILHRRIRAHRARWAVPTTIDAYLNATPDQFEQQTAALCRRDGATRIRVVGGAGDLAADVLATTPDGRRILIQCKRYKPGNTVGSDHVQRVNGTYRDIHKCDLAAIVTTSSFTIDARKLARRVGMRLLDGDALAHWARGGPPPWK